MVCCCCGVWLPQELESKTKALQDKYNDLRKEVAQRQLEVRYFM